MIFTGTPEWFDVRLTQHTDTGRPVKRAKFIIGTMLMPSKETVVRVYKGTLWGLSSASPKSALFLRVALIRTSVIRACGINTILKYIYHIFEKLYIFRNLIYCILFLLPNSKLLWKNDRYLYILDRINALSPIGIPLTVSQLIYVKIVDGIEKLDILTPLKLTTTFKQHNETVRCSDNDPCAILDAQV